MSEKDKIIKGDSGSLIKPGGAPDIQKLQGQRNMIMPASVKLSTSVHSEAPLQVVMMFDITGSMFKYFDLVRRKLKKIIDAVKKESPLAEFAIYAYRNHGDEDSFEQIYYASPLSGDQQVLDNCIANIKRGGGGPDALTCMEECLKEANKLIWSPSASKAIVIIGDMPPHGVIDNVAKCYNRIDYREEVKLLQAKKVKIYSVYCGEHKGAIREFFEVLPRESGGRFLEIGDIDILVELLIGICMKETGNLEKYLRECEASKQLPEKTKKALLMLGK